MSKRKNKRLWMRTTILLILLLAVAYTLYASLMKDKHETIAVGDVAPDFALTDMDGNKHRLSDYRGKGVFLNFWGTWCKPCEKEMPDIQDQYEVYKDQGVVVLAINMGEPPFMINNFLKKHDLSFPILQDKSKDVGSTIYDIYNLPATVLINPEGEITEIVEGQLPAGRIKAMMESIKP